jgi:predicted esterase
MVRFLRIVLFSFLFAWPTRGDAAVTIQFSDGARQTFESAQRVGDKIVCRTKYGTVQFSAAQLAPPDRARFFPESVPPPQTPSAPSAPEPPAPPAPPKQPDGLQPFQKLILDREHPRFQVPPTIVSEQLYVRHPRAQDPSRPKGVVLYLGSTDDAAVPEGWGDALDKASLIFVAPRNAGNDQPVAHRYALASLALSQLLESEDVDPSRVYVAGDSGGARLAVMLGYYEGNRIRGVIASSGANFHAPVPFGQSPNEAPYGMAPADPSEIDRARSDVTFVFITGGNDRRRPRIQAIVDNGFKSDGFRAHLIDLPDMAHGPCPGSALTEAIRLIESP